MLLFLQLESSMRLLRHCRTGLTTTPYGILEANTALSVSQSHSLPLRDLYVLRSNINVTPLWMYYFYLCFT